jgi:hypothetical protein
MIYPYPPHTAFISAQPKQYDIHSNFGMFPGEHLLYHSEMQTGCCDIGDTYFTSVTDTRYVARAEICVCCGCCCKRPQDDTCIYLEDVAQLREVKKCPNCVACLCCICMSCNRKDVEDDDDCVACRFCCLCLMSKKLQLRGSFGSHTVQIRSEDRADFELMMTEAVAQRKRLNQ